MLKGNNIEAGIVQERSPRNILADILVLDRQAYGLRIVVDAPGSVIATTPVAGQKTGDGNSPVKIVGEGCNAAAARKMITDERYSLDRFH